MELFARARLRADDGRRHRRARRAHGAHVLPLLRRQARGAVRQLGDARAAARRGARGRPGRRTADGAPSPPRSTPPRTGRQPIASYSRARQAVIDANAELRERELIKLASLAAALADGLRRRGVPDPQAGLAAETGIAVLRVAFQQWREESPSARSPRSCARRSPTSPRSWREPRETTTDAALEDLGMPILSPELQQVIEAGPLTHLSTINADGSPQVSVIWLGLDGDDLVTAHMGRSAEDSQHRARPARGPLLRRPARARRVPRPARGDPRARRHRGTERGGVGAARPAGQGLHGARTPRSRRREGAGYIVRYTIERVGGVGPWAS